MTVMLEVGIGIVFIYLLLSLVASSLTEWFARMTALRSNTLESGIRELLNDPAGTGLARAVYDHPLIKGLYQNGKKPSYIPSDLFARALVDVIAPAPAGGPTGAAFEELRQAVSGLSDTELKNAVLALGMTLTRGPTAVPTSSTAPNGVALRAAVDRMTNPDVKGALLGLMGQSGGSVTNVLASVAEWFDAAMDRVSGWYKRDTQIVTLVVAAVVAVLLNGDTLMIADGLARDPAVRSAAVAAAQQTASKAGSQATLDIATFQKEADQLQLPIGWSTQSGDPRNFPTDWLPGLRKALGLLLTIIAISLGAPFWFELLNKLLNLRLTGPPPPTSPASASPVATAATPTPTTIAPGMAPAAVISTPAAAPTQ